MRWTPNRIVAMGTGAIGVLVALASLAAAEGGPQAAGIAAGVLAVLVPAREWLIGWRQHEARQGEGDQAVGLDDLLEQLARLEPEVYDPLPEAPEALPPAERGTP